MMTDRRYDDLLAAVRDALAQGQSPYRRRFRNAHQVTASESAELAQAGAVAVQLYLNHRFQAQHLDNDIARFRAHYEIGSAMRAVTQRKDALR